jgi:hypothetical protein
MLIMAIGVPLCERISDFFSLRLVFTLGLSVFAAGVSSALSPRTFPWWCSIGSYRLREMRPSACMPQPPSVGGIVSNGVLHMSVPCWAGSSNPDTSAGPSRSTSRSLESKVVGPAFVLMGAARVLLVHLHPAAGSVAILSFALMFPSRRSLDLGQSNNR